MSKQQSIQKVTWVLLKAFSFKRVTEHKSLENLQLDNAIENKTPFSEEKFKPVAEICINNVGETSPTPPSWYPKSGGDKGVRDRINI